MSTLKLANGLSIDTTTGQRISKESDISKAMTQIQNAAASPFEVKQRRYLDELPGDPKVVTPIGAFLMYRMFGLSDDDIAYIMNVPVEKLKMLESNSIYEDLKVRILANVREFDTDLVRQELSKNALVAANVITSIATDTDAENKDRLVAAKDILDRTGNRPADVVEHRHSMEGGLTIRIVRQTEVDDLPLVEME